MTTIPRTLLIMAKTKKNKETPEQDTKPNQAWRNRIVGHGEEDPEKILGNPFNFRVHPEHQQEALAGVLDEVGWVQDVIINRTTQHLIDGHLRVSLALKRKEKSIPVVYVELSADEEKIILATLDPIAALANTDKEKLGELLNEVSTGNAAIQSMLSDLAAKQGLIPKEEKEKSDEPEDSRYKEQYGVIVICENEQHQENVYNEMVRAGYNCKVVTT